MEKCYKNVLALANRHDLLQINTLWWFLSLISICIQKTKTDMHPMKRYLRLKNILILMAESISLHAEACLFKSNIKTFKRYLDTCSHVCSKVAYCACFFHSCLSASKKPKTDTNPLKRSWRLQNSKALIALCLTSVMAKAVSSFFKKQN